MDESLNRHNYTAWTLIKLYWQSEQKKIAYFLLFALLLFTVILVVFDVAFTTWYNYFYNALQDYDRDSVLDLLAVFCFLAGIYIIFAVYRYYIEQYLALRWRKWLTCKFIDRWLSKRSYYYLENFDESTDNPDQRIQDDIGILVQLSISLTLGLVGSFITVFAFVFVLWSLSGVLTIPIGSFGELHIHGYLVWVGVLYAAIGTFFTFKIGRPLVSLNFEQQKREANFRFAAIDVRSHSEHVALYRGERDQKNILKNIFTGVIDNWYAIILRQKLLLWFTAGYNQTSVIVPLIVALPNYFNKVFKLGGLIQALSAFGKIQDAFSFIVNSYTIIAQWQAVIRRLLTFLNHMNELDKKTMEQNKFCFLDANQNEVNIKKLSVNTPYGKVLLKNIEQRFLYGKNYVLTGRSGIGKSTFLRSLAGVWPFGNGEIILPKEKNIMFIPQTSYMPLGSLRDALIFPDKIMEVPDLELIEILKECGLEHLCDQLDSVCRWSERLSGGELQRVAFVRILLHKPRWVFLDESTSSLDLKSEGKLYSLLKINLPDCSLISIGHRPSLFEYHDEKVDLEKYSEPS
ncbi:ABC transporter ATP-binding protein/permease [Gammaproteobacteria bacterium]|nr:ABC transporter ATP-binding protein/permease [Gammaproteobacteria bacterium]